MIDMHELFGTAHRKTYGPTSAKAHIPDPLPEHRAIVPPDDGGPITFRWHFQRGMLKPRMSGYELAEFILWQMPAVLGLLSGHPRVKAEFSAMMMKLAFSPREVTDQLVPWIRSVTREEESDCIHMSLFDQTEQPQGPTYFVLGE